MLFTFTLTLIGLAAAVAMAEVRRAGSWGDQGDGTYKNPILPGDFSDPDVIRVSADYYLITSTFQYSPGRAILHSKDLVNWQYLSHCIPDVAKIGPEMNWDRMNRYNHGVYAGLLRYHDGNITLQHPKPIDAGPPTPPQASDEFDTAVLGPQWEWNYEPRPEKWSLTDRPGFLPLRAFKPISPNNFRKAGNTLTQRVMGYSGGEVTVKMDVSHLADGQRAGLAQFSDTWSLIGVIQSAGARRIDYEQKSRIKNPQTQKDADQVSHIDGPPVTGAEVWLRHVIEDQAVARAQFSLDGKTFIPIGELYTLRWADYRGSRIGIYSFNNDADAGYVDVDWFHYVYPVPKR